MLEEYKPRNQFIADLIERNKQFIAENNIKTMSDLNKVVIKQRLAEKGNA